MDDTSPKKLTHDSGLPLTALSAQMVDIPRRINNPAAVDRRRITRASRRARSGKSLEAFAQSAAVRAQAPAAPKPEKDPVAAATRSVHVDAPVPARHARDEPIAKEVPWGPEVWPELVRQNVENWPPTFRERQLVASIQAKLDHPYRVAIIAGKRGVGKTSIARLLRTIFAIHREDSAAVLDMNPLDVRDDAPQDVVAPASDWHPQIELTGHAVDGKRDHAETSVDYAAVAQTLEDHYHIVLCDIGRGVDHATASKFLSECDRLVVVATPRLDGAYAATAALADVRESGHEELADHAIVALNQIRRMPFSDLLEIDRHFARRAGRVIRIAGDSRMDRGIPTNLDELGPSTRTGLYELAAAIAEGFNPEQSQ